MRDWSDGVRFLFWMCDLYDAGIRTVWLRYDLWHRMSEELGAKTQHLFWCAGVTVWNRSFRVPLRDEMA